MACSASLVLWDYQQVCGKLTTLGPAATPRGASFRTNVISGIGALRAPRFIWGAALSAPRNRQIALQGIHAPWRQDMDDDRSSRIPARVPDCH